MVVVQFNLKIICGDTQTYFQIFLLDSVFLEQIL